VSGIAHAFLELFAHTEEPRWQFAASRALAYEREHEIRATGDWPDYRYLALAKVIESGGLADLRKRLRAGESRPPTRTEVARAWCHGAPGISLTRIRALSLCVDSELVRGEAERALRATRESITEPAFNSYVLCHGLFGNADVLLIAREHLAIDDGGLIENTVEAALDNLGSRKRAWPTGAAVGSYRPSLLVGEAGIGLFLLRLACRGLPSALFISDWIVPRRAVRSPGSEIELRQRELESVLPTTFRAVTRLSHETARGRVAYALSSSSAVSDALADVCAVIREDDSTAGDMLREGLRLDLAALDEARQFHDFGEQFCSELAQPHSHEVDWYKVTVRLAPHARATRTAWAWSAWKCDGGPEPQRNPETYVLYRSSQSIQRVLIGPLAALVLDALGQPTTVAAVLKYVLDNIDPDPGVADDLAAALRQLLGTWLDKGLLEVVGAPRVGE
jgi:hypothetical protein